MTAPTPPELGQTTIVAGDTVRSIERPERQPLYEVRGQHGVRMVHWCWEAICQCCWGWVAQTLAGQAAARAWHAQRFGRGRPTFRVDGVDLEVESWAVITGWHVSLRLEGGRRVVVDRADNVVADSTWPSFAPRHEPVELSVVEDVPDPPVEKTRAMLAGGAPDAQLSLFGGAA